MSRFIMCHTGLNGGHVWRPFWLGKLPNILQSKIFKNIKSHGHDVGGYYFTGDSYHLHFAGMAAERMLKCGERT